MESQESIRDYFAPRSPLSVPEPVSNDEDEDIDNCQVLFNSNQEDDLEAGLGMDIEPGNENDGRKQASSRSAAKVKASKGKPRDQIWSFFIEVEVKGKLLQKCGKCSKIVSAQAWMDGAISTTTQC